MTDYLVTDAEAEEMAGTSGAMWIGYTMVARLLSTRAVLIGALDACASDLMWWASREDRLQGETERQPRPALDAARTLLAELHGDSTSGTSAPPESEKP